MKARRWLLQGMAVAVFFGMTAFAQDAGSTAGQGGSQNTTSAKKHHKSSASDSGSKADDQGGAASGASAADKKFVKDAAEGGLAEVDLGNLAKSQGSNDDVKQFGDKMVTDHSKANDELKSLAQQKGWTLPTEPKSADKAKKDRLSKMQGSQFDKAYMRDMVMDHEKDVREFKKCASSCKDQDLKAWAAKTAPTLEDHLKMAKDTADKVGAMKGEKSSSEKSSSKKSSESGSSSKPSGEKPSGAIQ